PRALPWAITCHPVGVEDNQRSGRSIKNRRSHASHRSAPSGLAILNLIPNPGRCPGLSPVTPLGLKTTSEVAVRLRPDVATRRQTVNEVPEKNPI
ncbi:MAG: hypothetical protein RL069_158, partial [Planctomycetota bacterium]